MPLDESDRCAFSPEQISRSTYRVWRKLAPKPVGMTDHPDELDDLGDAVLDAWLRLGRVADDTIAACEGTTFEAIAQRFYKVFAPGSYFYSLDVAERTIWEALAKHIATLVNAEDPEELGDLLAVEASWRDWMKERLHKQKKDAPHANA